MKKAYITTAVLIVFIVIIINLSSFEKVVFINVKPTIRMGNLEYFVTNDIIPRSNLGKQVGKVTQVIELVSFRDNPYKNPSKVYKIKYKKIDEEVALEMNGKIYIAKSTFASNN